MCITVGRTKRNRRIGISQGRQPLAERLRRRQPTFIYAVGAKNLSPLHCGGG
ncbi:MAG: hypothetical protein LBU34_12225 [Planctomycetaceae bacterium]|nr:hypothetical protein [Planctomycetaceae bacterium]